MKQHDWLLSPEHDQVAWAGSRCCSSITFVGHQQLHPASRWPPPPSSKWLTFFWVSSLCVCVPTTGDENLQQLFFGQALLHLHPHHITAEPLCLLLRLVERQRDRNVMSDTEESRCHGNSENLLLLLYWKKEQEENVNEQKGLFREHSCF